jgi:hypothetical protein
MARLNFEIPKKLHIQLTTIATTLGYKKRRVEFYTNCLMVGALQLAADADKAMIAEYSTQIAAEIIDKAEKCEGENPFSIEFKIGQYEVFCDGTLDLTYRETFQETRDSEAEYELINVGITLDDGNPAIYLNGVEIEHPIGMFDIEKEVIRQLK